MDKYKVVIVDDDDVALENLSFELWKDARFSLEGTARNGRKGKKLIMKVQPDLLFLDVEMPDMTGLELLQEIRDYVSWNMKVVFYTAYDKYMIQANREAAFDYLLKPFRFEDLEECIRKVRLKVHKADTPLEEQILFSKELQVKNSYIKNAVTYVRKHYAEEISSVMVAEELDINPAYFCRLFKKETGYTFGQYLTNYRIHVAEGLLNNFDLRINEVAEQVGIPDSNYFSQIFKKNIGMTPKEYQDTRGMSKI